MPNYCTHEDVKRILLLNYDLSGSTNPTSVQVGDYIDSAEDEIDRETKRSWKSNTITEEYYDIPENDLYDSSFGIEIFLKNRDIKDFDTNEGDKLEVWNGSSYEDWITAKTEGRNDDFWVDYETGILYLRIYWKYYRKRAVRLTYRHGASTVPKDIRDATAKLAAINILLNEDLTDGLAQPSESKSDSYETRVNRMQKSVDKAIHRYADPFSL